MSTLKANVIDSKTSTTDFKNSISANGDKQWVDTFGVIKTNRATIGENVTIPADINAFSAGPVEISDGFTVTQLGEWTII